MLSIPFLKETGAFPLNFKISPHSHRQSAMQLRLRFLPAALLFVGAAHFAAAQSAPGTVPLNPNATCPYPTSDQVVACLAQVEADEASRSGGPCSDGEWDCICNVSR